MPTLSRLLALPLLTVLAACNPGADEDRVADQPAGNEQQAAVPTVADDAESTKPYDGIAPDETLRFSGTEPFWGGRVGGGMLTYSTPESPDGETVAVERFAGRGGVSFSGTLGSGAFEMMVTPLACSDGMSDRTYPFTVTLKIGDDLRNGCGWTDRQPFEGPERP